MRKIVYRLRPRRIAIAIRAWAVIELAVGELGPDRLRVGDRVYLARRARSASQPRADEMSERRASAQRTAADFTAA